MPIAYALRRKSTLGLELWLRGSSTVDLPQPRYCPASLPPHRGEHDPAVPTTSIQFHNEERQDSSQLRALPYAAPCGKTIVKPCAKPGDRCQESAESTRSLPINVDHEPPRTQYSCRHQQVQSHILCRFGNDAGLKRCKPQPQRRSM